MNQSCLFWNILAWVFLNLFWNSFARVFWNLFWNYCFARIFRNWVVREVLYLFSCCLVSLKGSCCLQELSVIASGIMLVKHCLLGWISLTESIINIGQFVSTWHLVIRIERMSNSQGRKTFLERVWVASEYVRCHVSAFPTSSSSCVEAPISLRPCTTSEDILRL